MDEPSLDRVKQVFEQWSLYDAIIQHNYMRHSELIDGLRVFVNDLSSPLDILDMGCGDAWLAHHVFAQAKIRSYHGVDLSESALKKAAHQLDPWVGHIRFTCGDIATFLGNAASESSSLVLMSYSLHHFASENKQQILRDIQRVLIDGGHFLWVDLARQNQEDRETFLQRVTTHIRQEWSVLNAEQTSQAVDHVLASDFPETEGWMQSQPRQIGLEPLGCLYRDAYFGAWAFGKGVRTSF